MKNKSSTKTSLKKKFSDAYSTIKNSSLIENNNFLHYHLSYIDIIGINIFCFLKSYKSKKNLFNKLKEKMIEYIDYEKVIKEIISFKNYKKFLSQKIE